MKNILTGAARPVTDTNERVRKLCENRPFNAPSQLERQNRHRKTFTKAAAPEDDEETIQDAAPDTEAADDESAEAGEAPVIENDAQEE